MLSVLSMFTVGIGPSSSHTLGPMLAAKRFAGILAEEGRLRDVARIRVALYGSLALTGKGHHTHEAVLLGLAGYDPETVDIDGIPVFMRRIAEGGPLSLAGGTRDIPFSFAGDMEEHAECLPLHENGMILTAFSSRGILLEKTYYSIGGGVLMEPGDFCRISDAGPEVPYPFRSAAELLEHCRVAGRALSSVVLENELAMRTEQEVAVHCRHVWEVMQGCAERGMRAEGPLPGPLRLVRRAPALHRMLAGAEGKGRDPMRIIDWVNMFAFAVSEENAAGGRVVTAPTNGACGIVPAVLLYYDRFVKRLDSRDLARFFCASGAVGLLFRMNASISGAEVGCQGEVGVAASMAAAGLAELLGANPDQVCTAAEIAMEHNLGLTCDPVGGQVQIPCIERNAINAVTAINASRMAMDRSSTPAVSLDKVIEAMFSTGKDMNAKYRETAQGGLAAVRITGCS